MSSTKEKLDAAKSIEKQLIHAQEINMFIGSSGTFKSKDGDTEMSGREKVAEKLTETQAEIDRLEKQLKGEK